MTAGYAVVWIHYLAFALAAGSILIRGRMFKSLRKKNSSELNSSLFKVDTFWGISGIALLTTGLMRIYPQYLGKGAEFYLQNGFFHVKLTLFFVVFLLELYPFFFIMRMRLKKKEKLTLPKKHLLPLWIVNHTQMGIVLIMPLIGAMMARGVWLFER